MTSSPSFVVAALLATLSLPSQQLAIQRTTCIGPHWPPMMAGYWHPKGVDVEISVSAYTSTSSNALWSAGFLVLSVGNIGCGVQLPLPGCDPSLIQYDIAGPMSFDPSSILLVDPMFPSSTSQGWLGSSNDWHHRMSIPIAALPPAAQMWTWNAQVVLLDATAGCWMATKDSLQFWANQ